MYTIIQTLDEITRVVSEYAVPLPLPPENFHIRSIIENNMQNLILDFHRCVLFPPNSKYINLLNDRLKRNWDIDYYLDNYPHYKKLYSIEKQLDFLCQKLLKNK